VPSFAKNDEASVSLETAIDLVIPAIVANN